MTAAEFLEQPFDALCAALADGSVKARDLVDECLGRIEDPAGEGSRSFLSTAADRARAEADDIDAGRAAGKPLAPTAGIPVAVKDLFDVEGEVTTAGSLALADQPPAQVDAPSVARIREAGMIVLGRTNMTEFAYSGLGLNPHHDTPRSIWRRDRQHIPGGSSSGSAVAVADGQAVVTLGTDTGGSCRIPAAFSNVVGYKPTARLVPLDGVVPLAPSLDSVGPIAASTAACRAVHSLMAGEASDAAGRSDGGSLSGTSLAVLSNVVLEDLDDAVQERFEAALSLLSSNGVKLEERELTGLNDLGSVSANGGLAAAEAYAWHRQLIADRGERYDPLVRSRIEAGAATTDEALAQIHQFRADLVNSFKAASQGVDAWVLPTVAVLPPSLRQFAEGDDEYYRSTNLKVLRNTSVGNMLDSCAISLPLCQHDERTSAPPVGFMLMAPGLSDEKLFELAETAEPVLRTLS